MLRFFLQYAALQLANHKFLLIYEFICKEEAIPFDDGYHNSNRSNTILMIDAVVLQGYTQLKVQRDILDMQQSMRYGI